ncbi:MAG: TonB-dependent receptor [Sphingobacteriales bacterium]|nr:TonB-dependent receptor [Sphingobacteriales bacterium]
MHHLKRLLIVLFITAIAITVHGQVKSDSTKKSNQPLQEVVIKAYFSKKPISSIPSSVSLVDSQQLSRTSGTSLVAAINTVAGVRMEERSPGSYRLSIRGSLLRSPFGIRNVKIYLDDFPLTDAGGNTYLNLLDATNVRNLEILKGPEASVFGANSGGVILINTAGNEKAGAQATASLLTGSYGLFQQKLSMQRSWDKYQLNVNQTSQESTGYRENSALKRNAFQIFQQYNYTDKGNLKAIILFSDLNYKTPGGITAAQADLNPRQARQRAGNTPGAAEQQAGIFNRTIFGGISNEISINTLWKHVASVFGSNTNFKNPFITNFERRNEKTVGLRTYFEFSPKSKTSSNFSWQTGLEGSSTASDIFNFDNNGGMPGNVQSADQITANQYFMFTHAAGTFKKFVVEGAVSINQFNYKYGSLINPTDIKQKQTFKVQIMPRLAASYPLTRTLWLRASASKGYSPPTIAEVRSSDNNINADLQAESGWNYETGLRYKNNNGRIYADAVLFSFNQKNAIVRRVNAQDQEYFINAGGTKQKGLELQFNIWLISPSSNGFIRGAQLNNSLTYNNFKFSQYLNASDDYSGNKLTGVPQNTNVSSLYIKVPFNIYVNASHNYTSSIPLNDANSVIAKDYNLVQAKLGKKAYFKNTDLEFYVGGDNLLNKTYSLGNDLNAFGGRYYNPAPLRNYYLGFTVTFK